MNEKVTLPSGLIVQVAPPSRGQRWEASLVSYPGLRATDTSAPSAVGQLVYLMSNTNYAVRAHMLDEARRYRTMRGILEQDLSDAEKIQALRDVR